MQRCEICFRSDGVKDVPIMLFIPGVLVIKVDTHLCKGCRFRLESALNFVQYQLESGRYRTEMPLSEKLSSENVEEKGVDQDIRIGGRRNKPS